MQTSTDSPHPIPTQLNAACYDYPSGFHLKGGRESLLPPPPSLINTQEVLRMQGNSCLTSILYRAVISSHFGGALMKAAFLWAYLNATLAPVNTMSSLWPSLTSTTCNKHVMKHASWSSKILSAKHINQKSLYTNVPLMQGWIHTPLARVWWNIGQDSAYMEWKS